MKVWINKKEEQLPDGMIVRQLLDLRKMKRAAVWINGRQLLSAEYDTLIIRENDEIKLLRMVAGG